MRFLKQYAMTCIPMRSSILLAWVATERINDSHAQCERKASQALHRMWDHGVPTNMATSSWGGKPHAPYFFNHNAIGERFETKCAKLKIVSPTAMAKLAIDSTSLKSLVINREIFIPDREMFLIISKIGISPAKSGDLEALLFFPGNMTPSTPPCYVRT